MRAHRLVAIVAGIAALTGADVGRAQDGPPPPPVVVREGEHFRVLCHFDTATLADEALAAVESVWDAAHAMIPGPPGYDGSRDVHLYRSARDYALADAQITGGRFAPNMAFSWQETHSSHVALQPDHDDSVFAATGLPSLTLRTLIHEASHLVMYDSIKNHSDHPAWLAEGFATVVADRAMIASGLSPGPEAEPKSATRMVMAQELLERDALPSPRTIITTDLEELAFDERYAVRWLFFRFLAEVDGGKPAQTALRTARGTGGGTGFRERLAQRVEKAWGKRRLDAMEGQFREYVAALQPEWEEVHNTLSVRGDAWTQLAFAEWNAIAWRTAPVGKPTYTISGTVEILHSASPQMNLLLGRAGNDFVSVAIRAGFGITIFGYRSETDAWTRIGDMQTEAVAYGKPVPFEIEVSGKRITIGIADEAPLSWTVEGHDLTGPWGVGVQAGGAGVWRDVAVR